MRNYLLILLAIFCSCDEEVKYMIKPEIEMIIPAVEQGDIVNIPINAPIAFKAKVINNEDIFVDWSVEGGEEFIRGYRNEFVEFKTNDFRKVNFKCSEEEINCKTFAWLNILGKEVTSLDEDEVGCAVCDFEGGYYVFSKQRDKYNKEGMFISRFENGEKKEKFFDEDLSEILDIQSTGKQIYLLTQKFLVQINSENNQIEKYQIDTYSIGKMKFDNNQILYVGVNKDNVLVRVRREYNGELVEKQIILENKESEKILDIEWDKKDSFYATQVDYSDYYVTTFQYLDKRIRKKDDAYSENAFNGLVKNKDGVFSYTMVKNSDENWLFIENFYRYDYYMYLSINVNGFPLLEEDYLSNDQIDYRVWAVGTETNPFFLTNNQIIKYNSEEQIVPIFQGQSQFKTDWVQEVEGGALVLGNVKKVNEHGTYNKRYNILFKIDNNGNFTNL